MTPLWQLASATECSDPPLTTVNAQHFAIQRLVARRRCNPHISTSPTTCARYLGHMPAHDASSWSYPGARWRKFDFHTHTPASSDYPDPDTVTPQDWLLGFMRAGIDCVAITDHNSGEWIDPLKAALQELKEASHPEFQPLHLFPGVELTASGGTHVLAIFDPSKGSSDISHLLGAAKYQGERGASKRASGR